MIPARLRQLLGPQSGDRLALSLAGWPSSGSSGSRKNQLRQKLDRLQLMGAIDDMLLARTVDLVLRQELPSDLLVPLFLRKPDGLHPQIRLEFWSELQGWKRWIRRCLYRQQKPTWPA